MLHVANVIYSIVCLKKNPTSFQYGSNYDYHYIIKELAEEFKKQLPCLGENTERHISFIVSIEKEVTRTDKNGGEFQKTNIFHIAIC